MQILGVSVFDKMSIKDLLTESQFNQNVKELQLVVHLEKHNAVCLQWTVSKPDRATL